MVKNIHTALIKHKATIAVAESCTGGLISKLLTDTSGSSAYFKLGLVTYSNQAKTKLLKIPSSLIKKLGAVSEPVAKLMAKNVRKIAQADFSIGITGIAGPGGATKEKPIGTVFITLDSKNKTICKKFKFQGTRSQIRNKASKAALKLLIDQIR